jgi:hypothetical protein
MTLNWDQIKELKDGLDDLLDKVEDVEKWREFAERIDRARNGQIGDPVELVAILVDLLEYLADKVPMGPLERLVRNLLEVAIGALEAGASLVRWILLFRYRRARAAGQTPEEAARGVTNDRAAQLWLRLQERQRPDGAEDPAKRDDPNVSANGVFTAPTMPAGDPPRAWSMEHDACCRAAGHGNMPPTIDEMVSSSSRRLADVPAEYEVTVEFRFTHPCGIASQRITAATRTKSGAGQPDSAWIPIPRSNTGSPDQQFELTVSGTPNGRTGKAVVKSAGDMILTYRAVSNCGTVSTRYARVIS